MAVSAGASGDIFALRIIEFIDIAVAKAMIIITQQNLQGQIVVADFAIEGTRVIMMDPPFSQPDNIIFRDNG